MTLTFDAILFDIDGTLVDSTPAVERTWRTWATGRGLDADAIVEVCHGRRAEDTVATLLPFDEQAAAVAELEALELADLDGVVALPAVAELLQALPSNRWAAVTSGTGRLVRVRLTAAGLPVPEVLVAAEDVNKGKPDPQGYLLAASTLGVDITRCMVVEDAPAGLAAGGAAGAYTLAVTTSHTADELDADAHLTDLRQLNVAVGDHGLSVTIRRR